MNKFIVLTPIGGAEDRNCGNDIEWDKVKAVLYKFWLYLLEVLEDDETRMKRIEKEFLEDIQKVYGYHEGMARVLCEVQNSGTGQTYEAFEIRNAQQSGFDKLHNRILAYKKSFREKLDLLFQNLRKKLIFLQSFLQSKKKRLCMEMY